MLSFLRTAAACAMILLSIQAAHAQTPPAQATSAGPMAPSRPPDMPLAEGASRAAGEQPAGAYALDPRHASVLWRVRHNGVGLFTARFDVVGATMTFDPAHPEASSVSATIQTASVSTGVRNAQGALAFDGEIASVLGAPTHPQITFISRAITLTSATEGLIEGDLTLNGVTRPVTLETTFHGGRFVQLRGKQVLGFAARTLIRRSEFGVRNWTPFVGDDVEILIDAEFVKA